MIFSLPALAGGSMNGFSASVYSAADYLMLLLVILTTVLVLVAVIAVISAYAKDVKEAGTMAMPFMIVIMVVSLLPMLMGDSAETPAGLYAVPLYNSVQAMRGIFSFTYTPVQIMMTVTVNLLLTLLLVWLLTRMFQSEKVMFSR